MSTNDLQALFANIRPRSQNPSATSSQDHSTHPSAASAVPMSPPPPFSAVNPANMPNDHANAAEAAQATSNNATAQSLLNLLNFGSTAQNAFASTATQPETSASGNADPITRPDPARAVSASDLIARFMSPPTTGSQPQAHSTLLPKDQGGGGDPRQQSSTGASQDALLKLLSKTKSTSGSRAASNELSRPASQQPNGSSPLAKPESVVKNELSQKPLFTYTNPFESLHASRQHTPKASSPVPGPQQSPIFKSSSDIPQPSIETSEGIAPMGSPSDILPNGRRKLTPRSASARAERFVRESSLKSSGVPEPTSTEELLTVDSNTLPIRSADEPAPAVGSFVERHRENVKQEVEAKESPAAGADEWEDAEESPQEDEPRHVPVFNFPIKPFVSITLQLPEPSNINIRPDGVMEISRLKKDFDQLDRSLASATTKYIAYALTKNGGIRIIRQDDGNDRQVFKNSYDRIFNVSFCSTATNFPPSDEQAVLGTGVSGAVYYSTISEDGNDLFEKNELESKSLIFPPWPPAHEHTAGGVLKTRAKRSSRHPDYFAIGRGKSIHLIWPSAVMSSKYGITEINRKVDMDKLYQERNLHIATGKAGKDFAFSEDDTLIVSLDKTGRLRFWDIRDLTEATNATATRVNPVKVDVPLLSLLTAAPAEKSWPTSVLFLDKVRPYTKGGALRYVLVGLRQNHTLQLWDLALGKAVQELNFPHDNEADGICSVNYHPGSGIVVVGHPTRNSIFFIHLSAPKYTLNSSITQASYLQRIAADDPDLPKPDSTACMSGLREISFASKGQLRSVELLPVHKAPDAAKTTDTKTAQFELYVVHSKGVTCLTINKQDLGWDASNKVIHGVDAAKEGLLDIKELRLGTVIEESTRSKSPPDDTPPISVAVHPSKSKKKSKKTALASESAEALLEVDAPQTQSLAAASGSARRVEQIPDDPKEGKKIRNRLVEKFGDSEPTSRSMSPVKAPEEKVEISVSHTGPPASAKDQTPVPALKENESQLKSEKVSLGISGDWLDKEMKKIEEAVTREFRRELNNLRSNIQQDRVVQDTSASARQEAVMRLVSQTLTNNVERTMANIVAGQIQQVVVPAVSNVAAQAIRADVGGQAARSLHELIPRELATQLPAAVKTALSSSQLSQSLYDTVSAKIAKQVETQMSDVVKKQIVPTFERLSTAAAQQAATEVASRMQAEIFRFEDDRQRDTARIEQLNSIVSGMAETLQTMSRTQAAFQDQLQTTRPFSTSQATPSPAPIARPIPLKPKTKQELELEEIAAIMEEGKYEEGSIRWLHSEQQVELFDDLFVRYTPDYLQTDVSPLVAFSIAVTVAKSLDKNAGARLEWIVAAFDAVDLTDPEIADLSEHAPALLTSLIQKLESLYMTTAEADVNNPVLRQIPPTAKKAREMRVALTGESTRGSITTQNPYHSTS